MWYFYREKNTSKAIQSKCSKKFSESFVHEFHGFINRPRTRAHLVLRLQFSGLKVWCFDLRCEPSDGRRVLPAWVRVSLSSKTVLSSWFSLKTQDELSKAPDVNNGRRHNKQPLLSYHSVLTSNNKKKCCKYSWLFDFCSSIAHILHNSFQFRRPFVFLLTLPSHRDLI